MLRGFPGLQILSKKSTFPRRAPTSADLDISGFKAPRHTHPVPTKRRLEGGDGETAMNRLHSRAEAEATDGGHRNTRGWSMTRSYWIGALACALMACQSAAPQRRGDLELSRVTLGIENLSGLSGLTTDGDGHLWSVAERDWTLIEIHQGTVLRTVKLPNLGDDVDIEAITWMGGERFALGTERDLERQVDHVVEVTVRGEVAEVTQRWPLNYLPLALEPEPNEGIEALCALGEGWLLAIGEPVVTDPASGIRRAPMWRMTTSGKGITHGWLELTSEEVKIAALACRSLGDEAFQIVAVERHFGVMRVVGFDLFGSDPAGSRHQAMLHVELVNELDGKPNLEGITFGPDKAIWLVVDNAWRRVRGPNELVRIGRLPLRAAP